MIPLWMQSLSALAPFLLIASVGVAVFGVYKFLGEMANLNSKKAEEEKKRKEFIRAMSAKIQETKQE